MSVDLEIRPTPETKLMKVLAELQNNQDVYIAGHTFKYDGAKWDYHDIFVAPKSPTFDPDKLTGFAESLIEQTTPECKVRKARLHYDGDMQLPNMFFDEQIGLKRAVVLTQTTTTISDPNFKGEKSGIKQDIEELESPIIQRTSIRVYPDIYTAISMHAFTVMALEDQEKAPKGYFAMYCTHVASAEVLKNMKRQASSNRRRAKLKA